MKTLLEIIANTPVIAHRGCWGRKLPENSFAAIEKAIDKGYPVELDVHLTADNSIIVFHDHSLTRMCKARGIVEEMNSSELTQYKLHASEHTIPTLAQVLKMTHGRAALFIELKCRNNGQQLADALLDLLKDYEGDIVFVGFEHEWLKYLQSHGYPVCASSFVCPKPPSGEFKPDGLLTNISFTPLPEFIRKKYPPFVCWTVSTPYQRWKARRICPAAIYNTKDFKDLRK